MAYKPQRDIKREISFKKSLFRFSAAFVVVLISGLIARAYIHRIDLQSYIPEDLVETEKYLLTINEPALRFSKGWWPIVGVFSSRVEWKDRACPSRRIVAQDLFVVLDFMSLLKGELKPGRVDISHVDMTTPSRCDLASAKEISGSSTQSVSKPKKPLSISKEIKESYPKEAFSLIDKIQSYDFFPKLNVDDFDFKLLKSYQEELELKGSLALSRTSEVKLSIQVEEFYYRSRELPLRKSLVQFKASGEKVSFEIDSAVREGKFGFKAEMNKDEGFNSLAQIKIEKLPLSPFAFLLFDKSQVRYLWLNCVAEVTGPWGQIQDLPILLQGCELDGPYGTAKVHKSKLNLRKLSELEVEFNQFKVDEILKSKREAYFSGVFSKYGQFSSLYTFENGHWTLKGFLDDSEIIFSRNNLRDIQKIVKLPFEVKGYKEDWKILFDKIELQDGQLEGNLEVRFDDGVKKAQGKLSIHKLLLNPKIYKLMILGQPVPLTFYGKIEIEDRKLSEWSALVTAKDIKGDDYQFSALKIEAQGQKDEFAELKILGPQGKVSPQSELIQWIQPTSLAETWADKDYEFKEFSVRLKVDASKNVNWERGYLKLNNGWQLSSEGKLLANSTELEAWLQWDKPNRNYLKWEHNGSFLKEGWEPKTQWVQDWLKENPEYVQKNEVIQFANLEPKKVTEELNEMGKKTIEKVKDVLSIDKKENKGS
ncbi:MAG: hypothetical protein HRT44_06115 [Bdellovibrionales bacterium]|nr:hypothetical protein [Bdellovibrionales bacterium]